MVDYDTNLLNSLFEFPTKIIYSISNIIRQSTTKFKLTKLSLKVTHKSVELIFTTLKCEITVLPL